MLEDGDPILELDNILELVTNDVVKDKASGVLVITIEDDSEDEAPSDDDAEDGESED